MPRLVLGIIAACGVALLSACGGHQHAGVLPPAGTRTTSSTGGGLAMVQTVAVTSSLGATLATTPANGDLLIAIGFNGISSIGCASGWTAIRHISASYVDMQSCYRIANNDTSTETSFAGTASNIAGQIWEITGQSATGFIDAETGAEAGPRTVTLTFAPANSGDLIVGASGINNGLSGITPANFTNDASTVRAGSTGFSDLAAHEANASAGAQSVTWAYNSTTDTHPVTAAMIAVDGAAGTSTPTPSPTPTATPTATPVPTPTPIPTPTPTPGAGPALVQKAAIVSALGAALPSAPLSGDLLIAIGFNGITSIGCASGWTSIRHISASYVDLQSCYRLVSGDSANETPFSGTAANIAGEMWEIAGEAPSGFIDAEKGAEGGAHTVTLTFAPPHSKDLIVGASAINSRLNGVLPTGFALDTTSTPAGSTGFSDFAAHELNAVAGTQSIVWGYSSTTDTHPVTADMIAVFGSAAATPPPPPTPTPGPTPTPNGSTDWVTAAYDLQRSGYNPNEHTLGASNISGVHLLWTRSISGEIGEPTYASNVTIGGVAANVLYAPSTSGAAFAINADTGAVLWTHTLGTVSYMCGTSTSTFGASAAPVVDRSTNRVYFPDGAANVHALDMATGAEIAGWPINIASPANHNFIFGALTYNPANGMLYAETSSTCDISPWYGRISAINASNATIVNTFFPTQGASGGGIWGFGGASIDPSTNNVYVATGNSDTTGGGSQTVGYAEQVVALNANLSTVLGNFYATLPVAPDSDFGATPMLFQPPGCPLLAAAVNKSGLFVLYNASNISAGPLQTIQMSIPSDAGDFVGLPAWDPVTNYVYVGLPATEGIYKPGLGAFGMQMNCTLNPTPAWNANFGADGAVLTSDDTLRSPITIANGVVYVSDYQTKITYAFNAASGAQLFSQALSGLGVVGPIVANGRLYTSDSSGTIKAWSP